ncbi:hypothetical protein YWIDRAFT_06687 [Streptomyces sp. SceaMP-e96]|uniref:hypothetical protein n=1 Tax=unclassified Streptomyces TaxID=2593676 RepID=UPI000823AE86|nr:MULTISPECIES: hypothetical protein [unclassified Streptomyces]MYT17090.1 hypothetical protein [Streptomyces sp. SID4951]SCK39712.1 hypothetical protein YWIDRAFT_06687 [Streptomyces sp. SceaMP-e96]
MAEEVFRDAGERLNACSVQPEDVVCADELNAEELLTGVLNTACGCVREAGEVTAALALGQVLDGCLTVTGEGG